MKYLVSVTVGNAAVLRMRNLDAFEELLDEALTKVLDEVFEEEEAAFDVSKRVGTHWIAI